jgi:predicted nucleic acid-binding protein
VIVVDSSTARQLFRSLVPLPMLGARNAWKSAVNYRELRRRGVTVRKTIDGMIATACIEANLPLLFSDRDFNPSMEHLGLEGA